MLCHIFSKLAMRSLADSPSKKADVPAKGNARAGRRENKVESRAPSEGGPECAGLPMAALPARTQIKARDTPVRERLRRMRDLPRKCYLLVPLNDLWVAWELDERWGLWSTP